MNIILFGMGFAFACALVYRRAYHRGYAAGHSLGLCLFRSHLPRETYVAICQKRIKQIDELMAKTGKVTR